MNHSVFWTLVRKDLYLLRGFMFITVLTGFVALGLIGLGKFGFAVGGILFLTADIASGIFIGMYSLLGERKALSRLFAMSLPISGFRYDLSKLVSGYLAYGLPWLVLTGIAVGVFLVPGQEHGMVIYALVLQMYVLALFSAILAALFAVQSEGMSAVIIIVVNIFFSLFVAALNQPQIAQPFHGPTLIWTRFAVLTLCGDAVVVAIALTFSLLFMSRRRDYL